MKTRLYLQYYETEVRLPKQLSAPLMAFRNPD